MPVRPVTLFTEVLRTPLLRNLLLLIVAVGLAFPLYDRFVGYPRFDDLLIRFTADDAQRVASHLARELGERDGPLTRAGLPPGFATRAHAVQRDLRLEKLKLFAASGEVLFSTDPQDIGTLNRRDYFHDVVMRGAPFTKVVRKDAPTAEERRATVDVVEAYVPIVRGGTVVGAFEVYYDITARRAALDALLDRSFLLLLGVAGLLLAAALGALLYAAREQRERADAAVALSRSEARFRNIAATAQDALIEVDGDGRITYWNAAAERIFGFPADVAVGRDLVALTVPERLRESACGLVPGSGGEVPAGTTFESVGLRSDGRELALEVSVAAFEGRAGRGAICIARDVSERKEAEQRLKLGASVIEHANQGIMITGADTRILMVNGAFTRLTGYAADEARGQTPDFLKSGRHDARYYEAMWDALNARGHWQGEIWNRRKDGALFPEWLSLSAIRDGHGAVSHYVGMFSDISPLKAAEADLERLAFYDPLTGLANRLLFRERLQQAMKEARRRGSGWVTALLYLDLDGFKEVNDRFGHQAGDGVLRETAKRIGALVREVDTVARLGGDEFAIVLTPLPDTAVVTRIAQQLVDALGRPYGIAGPGCRVGTSIGIAYYPEHAGDLDVLVQAADAAMYRAKQGGRNRYVFATTAPARRP